MRYCFVFVCQQGELELKALLLAASLNRFLRVDHELVVAMPQPESLWGRPSAKTLALLRRWGARIVPISNPVGPDYPIGNKLPCLQIETAADKLVFLDSDMLCLREFKHQSCFESPFNAKPADLATFGFDADQWQRIYATLGLSPPQLAMTATVSGELMPPYFNAGFIAVHRDDAEKLGAAWIAAALTIDDNEEIKNKRPWLDQIALPVALAKLGLSCTCLDERYNYPAHLKPLTLDPDKLPFFCHYHTPSVLRREPRVNALLTSLAREHPDLAKLLEADPAWQGLLQAYKLHTPAIQGIRGLLPRRFSRPRGHQQMPELIITGIPRSGSSYFCKLVHAVRDCVVINEPTEIFQPLAQQSIPWGVATHYRELRRNILDGKPIKNKLNHGEFIEDTALTDKLESYLPKVTRPDFLLATKNTLAYLARLPQLRRAMPEAAIAACVRHPMDTIASWKTTFPHLANADMEAQLIGNSSDPNLSGLHRERLKEIAAAASVAMKRALLWRYLAEILLDHRQSIVLIHYEALVADPFTALKQIFAEQPLPLHFVRAPVASSPRSKREALDAEDIVAIGGVCAEAAAELGYELNWACGKI